MGIISAISLPVINAREREAWFLMGAISAISLPL
jgi:hypothetical protein